MTISTCLHLFIPPKLLLLFIYTIYIPAKYNFLLLSFTNSFQRYLLNTYYVLGILLDTSFPWTHYGPSQLHIFAHPVLSNRIPFPTVSNILQHTSITISDVTSTVKTFRTLLVVAIFFLYSEHYAYLCCCSYASNSQF